MKILRISLRNLASLAGTHTVDFTREPLRTAGLFSISGPTGAGKSTLLDALCLALYDDTPRLRGIGRLADLGNGERQNDPRNLLRRGAGEGFAEVTFAGVDGAIFTARWLVRRARGRGDGALQNTEMTLLRGDVRTGAEGVIEQGGKKTEVLAAIAQKVGLTFEQFTRAVLLAQNDFATFLKAADHERAEILQALTGTARFAAISIAVFARCSAEQRAVAEIEVRLAGNAPLAAEGRAEAETVWARAEAEWKEAGEKLRVREAHAAWFQRLGELSRQVSEAARSFSETIAARDASSPRRSELQLTEEIARAAGPLREAEARLHAETAAAEKSRDATAKAEEVARRDLAEKKLRHTAAETALVAAKNALELAKPQLLQARELDAKLLPITDRLMAATKDREAAELGRQQLTAAREALVSRRTAAETERTLVIANRSGLEAFEALAPAASVWLHRLDHATACRRASNEAAEKWESRAKSEKAQAATASAERAKEAELRVDAQAAAVAFEQAEAAARAFDAEKISCARSEADAARGVLRELENHLRERDLVTGQIATVNLEIAALNSRNDADAKALADLAEKRIPAAESVAVGSRRAFELAEAAVTDEAIRLREKLAPGEPCPVCGAKDHPHATQPPAGEAAALRVLRADCDAKEKALRELREMLAGLAATRAARVMQGEDKGRALSALRNRLAELRALHHVHPAVTAIVALAPGEQASALAAQIAAQQQALAAAEEADTARRAAEKLRDERRLQHDSAAAVLAALEKRLAQCSEESIGLRVAREAAETAHAEAEKLWRSAHAELDPLFASLAGSAPAWERDPTSFRASFSEKTAAFLAVEKRLGELSATLRECDAALAPANEALGRADAEARSKLAAESEARSACEMIRTQRASIFMGRLADAVEAELARAIRAARETRDLWAGEFDKANNQLIATSEASKSAAQTLADSTRRQAAARAALDAWLASFAARVGRAFGRADLDVVLARDEAWIKAERTALDALEGAVRKAEGALAVHRKTHDEHLALRPTPDEEATVEAELVPLRTAQHEAEQRRAAARAILVADDQRRASVAELARELESRRALAEPWLKLNELIGSADGAKFRGIAQRRTLDILLGCANAQLGLLAARYGLERLPESLNLIVVDRDMGDERRSVHSLSGGESFLVSLALALALASLTSNRVRIESLFIDEGFGSLDPETLNTAMNALMHLEAQGRKVGVISHVTEMTDAIPVQIRVIKGRSGASRLVVPGAPHAECDGAAAGENANACEEAAGAAAAAQILDILRREKVAGRSKVSTRALREEIGCELVILNAARSLLAGQIALEGKSVSLVDS
ncbi:MAG: AAA family ATPase [Chthoniobacteraceae bacterium]